VLSNRTIISSRLPWTNSQNLSQKQTNKQQKSQTNEQKNLEIKVKQSPFLINFNMGSKAWQSLFHPCTKDKRARGLFWNSVKHVKNR
jgi:hypothetical protein